MRAMTIPALTFFALGFASHALGQILIAINEPKPRGDMISLLGPDAEQMLNAAQPDIVARERRIRDELAQLARKPEFKAGDWAKEWAGEYTLTPQESQGTVAVIAPGAGIAWVSKQSFLDPTVRGRDAGEIVEVLPDGLRLSLVFGSDKLSFLSERMYFVKCGDTRFLVPDYQMAAFANEYNTSPDNRAHMSGILRKSEHKSASQPPGHDWPSVRLVTGRPILPAPFDTWLHDEPIWLRVISVGALSTATGKTPSKIINYTAPIELEGGADRGIYVGMKIFYPLPPQFISVQSKQHGGVIYILSVSDKTCSGELRTYGPSSESPKVPNVGDQIKSGLDEQDLKKIRFPGFPSTR